MATDPQLSPRPPGGGRIRPLAGLEEYEACVEVQSSAWGEGFADLLPARFLMMAHETGGILTGAFDESGRLLGFVFGIPALDRGTLYHWSHMLAVRPEARGRGLGIALKVRQREILLERDVRVARWTFDPLEARNAHINLNRLGCRVERYIVDMYGRNTGSPLHEGLGTDRFVVAWELASPRTEAALDRGGPVDLARFAGAPRVGDPDAEGPRPPRMPSDPRVRVAIPARIQEEKAADPETGRRWRRRSRQALRWYLERGYDVVGLDAERGSETSAYCLERGSA